MGAHNRHIQPVRNNGLTRASVLRLLPVLVLDELWIAREKLDGRRNNYGNQHANGTKVPLAKTWTDYCQEIGSSRRVVNRWLARAGYLAIARQKNESEAVEAVEKASTGEVVLNGEPPLVSPQEAVSASRDKSPMIRTLDSNPSKFFYQWDFCPIDLTFYPLPALTWGYTKCLTLALAQGYTGTEFADPNSALT